MAYAVFKNVVSILNERKITIHQLEKTAGIGNGTIAAWEHDSQPKLETIAKVAAALNVSISSLIEEN